MKRHIERARDQLGELAALSEKTLRAERKILAQSEKRLGEVDAEIKRVRPGVETADDDVQKLYTSLVTERGQLHQVIGKARQAIAQ